METAKQSPDRNPINNMDMAHFTGTEGYFFNPVFGRNMKYTDGCKYLSDNGAGWLITDCLAYAMEFSRKEQFLAFILTVDTANTKGVLSVQDGNGNELKKIDLNYTDFPLDKVTLYYINNVLMLSSEY